MNTDVSNIRVGGSSSCQFSVSQLFLHFMFVWYSIEQYHMQSWACI